MQTDLDSALKDATLEWVPYFRRGRSGAEHVSESGVVYNWVPAQGRLYVSNSPTGITQVYGVRSIQTAEYEVQKGG